MTLTTCSPELVCPLSHTMADKQPSDCFRLAAGLKLLLTIFIAVLHRGCLAQVTHPDEIEALKTIADKLGKADLWDFSVDPCTGGNSSWSTGNDWQQNNVTFSCSLRTGKYYHVTNINLKTQDLPGVIPPELANLTYLEEIDFTRNYLNGSIPAALGSLANLRILSLGINRLSGPIPKELGNLTNLETLVVLSNNLYGTLPPELGNLTTLKTLHVSTNQFVGEIPSTFANLRNMEDFQVSSNNFTGKIPAFIGNWMNLQSLVFHGTSMEGPIPSIVFSNLTQLRDLRISDITQGDSTLSFLQNLAKEKLKTLVLRNNLISGQIPGFIGYFSILKTLDLSFNNLTGPIPNSFKSLRNLEYLFLGNNQLMGQYPFELASNIKNIDLSFNNLSGEISLALIHDNNVNLIGNLFYTNSTDESRTQGCLGRSYICHKEDPKYTSLAINCGGPQLSTSAPNIFFEADNESLGVSSFYMSPTGNWAVSATGYFMDNSSIKNYTRISNAQFNSGLDPRLYTTARLSPISLKYYGLRLYNGQYNIQLHFAETQISDKYTYRSLGLRIFDVYIQGRRVLKDFNMKRNAGDPNAVVIKNFTVNVTESTLEIHFYWAGKGSCCVPYKGVYGPLISAIIISADFKVPKRKHNNLRFLAAMAVVPVIALVLMIVFKKRKRRDAKFFQGNEDQELSNLEAKSNHFSLRELKVATNGFHPSNKIGEGGFGAVYKGMTRDGKVVAIKQLSSKSKQGSREFLAEVGTISAVQHPNLVQLYGCCAEGEELLLVYEYMENGNLANALFGTEPGLNLDWAARYNICIGVARGLAYLHEESRLRIVHRDIKSTNILLDEHLDPKITDFGLAKLFEEEKTHISTRVAGTVGYMAPEYALRGLLTEKADVYSFGVVSLEVVSGRKHTQNDLPEEMVYLLEWTWHLYQKKKVLDLIDVRLLHSRYSEEEVMRVITVALLCTHPTPSLRPSMSTVVDMLEGKIETLAPHSGPGYLNHWQSLALVLGKNILEEPSTHSRSLRKEGPWQESSSSHTSFVKQEESGLIIHEAHSDSDED